MKIDRRNFLKLTGLGSTVLVLSPRNFTFASDSKMMQDDFLFIQLSDSHWGFTGPKVNPDS